ncbi:MAG: DUF4860 domain-containing protein [Coprobacillus sp.]
MKSQNEKQHTIDILFVLALFCVFTLSALAVVYIGSRVYSSTVDTMDINFHNHVAIDYITEKVHQNDDGNNIEIQIKDNIEVLSIHKTYNSKTYTTYIYLYDNQLKELFISDEESFQKDAGENIMQIDSLSMKINQNLLSISLSINNKSHESYISLMKGDLSS